MGSRRGAYRVVDGDGSFGASNQVDGNKIGGIAVVEHGPDSEAMPDLADLIQRRRDAGRSYRQIARDSGDLIDAPTVERWHKRTMSQFPRDMDTFVGWARALDENVEQVLLSMASQLGVPVPQYDPAAGILPAGSERLTYEQRRALRALVRSIIDAQATEPAAPAQPALDIAAHQPADGESRRSRRRPGDAP